MSVYVGVVVGVSLLRNALAGGVGGGVVERALAGDADAERELGLAALGGRLGRGLLEFACGDVEGCCAELSTVSALRRAVPGRFRVEFFYTDTKASWLCAVTMAECLGRGVLPDVEVVGSVQVPLFGGDPDAALSSLVDVVGRRLYGAVSAGSDAYVVVTGGTKAEAVLASMVAWLVGARPVYRMEGGPLVVLPRLPIALAGDFAEALCRAAGGDLEGADELARTGLVVRRGGRYVVPRWVADLLAVKGLCRPG